MICTEYDSFLKQKDKTVWIVELEHEIGQGDCIVYQDDDRPGLDEPKAWLRLKQFLKEDLEFAVKRYGVMFRDHIEWLPIEYPYAFDIPNRGGIYFSYGFSGDMFDAHTANYYVLGVVEGDNIHKYWYRVPELILYDETWDKIPPSDDPRLIC